MTDNLAGSEGLQDSADRKERRIRAVKLAEQIEAIMRSEPDKHIATDAYTLARSFFFQK
jgi:hypothetical protein